MQPDIDIPDIIPNGIECYDCGGIGTITNDMDEDITCPMCDGSGVEPLEPFEEVF